MHAWSFLECRHGATRVQLQTLIWKSKKYTIDASLHTHILSNWIYWKQLIAYPAHLALFFSLGLPLSRIDDKNHINQLSSFKSKQVLSMFDFVSSLWGGATSRRIPSLTYISLEQVGWGPRRLSWSSWSSCDIIYVSILRYHLCLNHTWLLLDPFVFRTSGISELSWLD